MSNIQGVKILKQTGKLTAGPSGDDRISGLIVLFTAAPSGAAFGTSHKLTSVADAEAIGIDEDFDTDNDHDLYHNVTEFFRLSPSGVLWIMVLDSATVTPSAALEDTNATYAKKLLTDADGKIRQLAVQIYHGGFAGTFVNGIPTEVSAAIPKAQLLGDWAYTNHRPCQLILGCPQIESTIASLGDLRAITGVIAPKVSVLIGQDKAVADRVAAYYEYTVAIGACLGMISRRKVNENIGWVADGNLQDVARGRFLSACLSTGVDVKTYEASWQALDDKGYIFVMAYTGRDGFYFNNDHTCAALAHDEAFISRGRVKDKAARYLRTALLPSVKSPQPVDPETGKLPQVVLDYFNALGEKAIDENLTNNSEISGRVVRTDPDSDLINAPRTLKIAFAIVPYGEVSEIEGTLEFVSSTQ